MSDKIRRGSRPNESPVVAAQDDPLERLRELEMRERRRLRYMCLAFGIVGLVVLPVAFGATGSEMLRDLGDVLVVGLACAVVGLLRRRRRG